MQLNIESFIISTAEMEYVINYIKKFLTKKSKDGNKRGHEMFSKLKDQKYEYFIKINNYLVLNLYELENLQKYINTVYKCEDDKLATSSKEYMYFFSFMKNIATGLDYLNKLSR